MSIAKKCDICGNFYPMYNFQNDRNKPNGFMFLNIDSQMNYYNGAITDCCPSCMKSIQNCIKSLKKI